MKTLLFCFGTRPEAIKLAPLILGAEAQGFRARICLTGQHKELIAPFNEFFGIRPDINLEVMSTGQSLHALTAKIISGIEPVLKNIKPDAVVVQGDTTSALACALGAFYSHIPIVHVEAGLRTEHMNNPFPEEMNRRLIGRMASFHFAPTALAQKNLKSEGLTSSVYVTGNTGIDALRLSLERTKSMNLAHHYPKIDYTKKIILTTVHRRENFETLDEIFGALATIVQQNPDAEIVFPVHLNPTVRAKTQEWLANTPRIHLLEPLDYPQLISLLKLSYLVLTDSGGLQEEAPYVGKPVLVMRTSTERQEGVDAGNARIVGNKKDDIIKNTLELLGNEKVYASFQKNENPYGDGYASEKILATLAKHLG